MLMINQVIKLTILKCCLLLSMMCSNLSLSYELDFSLDQLTIYSDIWPPYQTLSEKGVLVGLATKPVVNVLKAGNISFEIKVTLWAKILHLAKFNKNALIYSLSRTKQREYQFYWIQRLEYIKIHLVSLC